MFRSVKRTARPAPDEWTPERRERFRVLDACGGNVERAQTVLAAVRREEFARWLRERGHLNEWGSTAL